MPRDTSDKAFKFILETVDLKSWLFEVETGDKSTVDDPVPAEQAAREKTILKLRVSVHRYNTE